MLDSSGSVGCMGKVEEEKEGGRLWLVSLLLLWLALPMLEVSGVRAPRLSVDGV